MFETKEIFLRMSMIEGISREWSIIVFAYNSEGNNSWCIERIITIPLILTCIILMRNLHNSACIV